MLLLLVMRNNDTQGHQLRYFNDALEQLNSGDWGSGEYYGKGATLFSFTHAMIAYTYKIAWYLIFIYPSLYKIIYVYMVRKAHASPHTKRLLTVAFLRVQPITTISRWSGDRLHDKYALFALEKPTIKKQVGDLGFDG